MLSVDDTRICAIKKRDYIDGFDKCGNEYRWKEENGNDLQEDVLNVIEKII